MTNENEFRSIEDGRKYFDEMGDRGTELWIEGKSMSEARLIFYSEMEKENKQLAEQADQLREKLDMIRRMAGNQLDWDKIEVDPPGDGAGR